MTMEFNTYWEEKAQKRRKSWASKAKRFAERHMQLAAIRSEVVFSRMDRREVLSLLDEHRTVQNPIARWDPNLHFSFSEQGLREAMQAEGADVSSLTMTVSKKTIVGQQPHEIAYGSMLDLASNRRDLYEKYTDLETCTINYREVTMVIYRYTYLQQPFALYEFLPCKQLSFTDLRLEETSFSTLNIASLLMEIAAEYELRQEELNYHAKKLRLRTMDAALTDDISFELWDDRKLEKKVAEYVNKDYPVEKMLELVLRPWKQAITKYFRDITEQELHNPTEKFDESDLEDLNFRNNVLQPYFNKHGLQEVKVWKTNERRSDIRIEYQGYQLKYTDDIFFYPNAHYPIYCTNRVPRYSSMQGTPLRALADYLRKMPEITRKTDEVVIKVMRFYDGLMQQKNEKYCKNVEFLDSLAAQHKGTPVGKMMKFLRWNAGRFSNSESKGYEFSIPTIKVLGETSFSFVRKDVLQSYSMVNGQLTVTYKDEVIERWLDADCQNVYVADPVTTDYDEWEKTHRKGMFVDRWSWSVQNFLSDYSPRDSKPSLLIDFIEQKL
jgi:hypothetical protein